MKKTNNEGFSLVELIVVIAIMAVLVGVLAPQLLRYVERSRVSTDNQAVAEVANAVKIAMANETVYNEVGSGDTVTLAGTYSCTSPLLLKEIQDTCGTGYTFKSNVYTTAAPQITVTVSAGTVTVTAATMYENDGTTLAGTAGTITY